LRLTPAKSAALRAGHASDKKLSQPILRLFLQTTATYPHSLILDPLGIWDSPKINYDTQAPRLTAKKFYQFYRSEYEGRQERTPLHNYVDSTTHFKSSVWSREQEWRILWRNDETRLKTHKVKIPEDAISAVYVGLAASPSVQDDVVYETRRNFPTAKIFKARKRNGYAELRFEQI
jgi:hypothetical protein